METEAELVQEGQSSLAEEMIAQLGNNENSDMEEGTLFDNEQELPFEQYFNVNQKDVHNDKSQTISLVPLEDDDEDEQPKFKGFFKKKK